MSVLDEEVIYTAPDAETAEIVKEFEEQGKILGTFEDEAAAAEAYAEMILGDLGDYEDEYDYPEE